MDTKSERVRRIQTEEGKRCVCGGGVMNWLWRQIQKRGRGEELVKVWRLAKGGRKGEAGLKADKG